MNVTFGVATFLEFLIVLFFRNLIGFDNIFYIFLVLNILTLIILFVYKIQKL